MLGQHPLHIVDVHLAVESFDDTGSHFTGDPYFQFCIQVKMAAGLDAEFRYTLIAGKIVQ